MEKVQEQALEPFIQKELEKFEIKKEDLEALVKSFEGIIITGVDDKEGYRKVHDARMAIKKKRVEITQVGKTMRAKATAFNKAVIAREYEFVEILEPREIELQIMEDDIDEQREIIRQEKERKEDARIQTMSDALAKVGYAADYVTLKGFTEQQYADTLHDAGVAYAKKLDEEQKERDALAEKNRLEEEARVNRENENREERKRLQKIQEDQDRENDRLKAERDQIDKDKAEMQRQKIAARRQRMFDSGFAWHGHKFKYKTLEVHEQEVTETLDGEFSERMDGWRTTMAKIDIQEKEEIDALAEKNRLQAIEDQKEKDRLAKEAEEEKLNEGPDSDRFDSLHTQICEIVVMPLWDSFKTKVGKKVAAQVKENLKMAITLCETRIKK